MQTETNIFTFFRKLRRQYYYQSIKWFRSILLFADYEKVKLFENDFPKECYGLIPKYRERTKYEQKHSRFWGNKHAMMKPDNINKKIYSDKYERLLKSLWPEPLSKICILMFGHDIHWHSQNIQRDQIVHVSTIWWTVRHFCSSD